MATSIVPNRIPSPFLAVAGVADMAATQARQVPGKAEAARKAAAVKAEATRTNAVAKAEATRRDAVAKLTAARSKAESLPEAVPAQIGVLRSEAAELPARVKAFSGKAAATGQAQISSLTERGQAVVARVQSTPEADRLLRQAKATSVKAKAAKTTAVNAASSTQRALKAAFTSATHSVDAGVDAAGAAVRTVGEPEATDAG